MRFIVDVRRWFTHLFRMPKDHDDDRQRDELTEAICRLTCELFEFRKLKLTELDLLRCNLATKRDLMDAKNEILRVLSGGEIADADLHLLAASLVKAGGIAKRIKAVAVAMTALDAAT